MFSTALRHRPDLPGLIPHLTPSLHETTLQTHDLALPITSHHHLFLLLTPTSLHSPSIHERITRFSTLTTTPLPTIAFILSTTAAAAETTTTNDALRALMHLQIITNTLPTPPPILPIPSLTSLLPLLKTYTTPPSSTPFSLQQKPTQPLHLLPHVTSSAPAKPLSAHDTNVLSDLCHSLSEVVELARSERGEEVLREWFGEGEARGMREFWEGEWIVE